MRPLRIIRLRPADKRVHLVRKVPGGIARLTLCWQPTWMPAKTRGELREGDRYCQTCLSRVRMTDEIRQSEKDEKRRERVRLRTGNMYARAS